MTAFAVAVDNFTWNWERFKPLAPAGPHRGLPVL